MQELDGVRGAGRYLYLERRVVFYRIFCGREVMMSKDCRMMGGRTTATLLLSTLGANSFFVHQSTDEMEIVVEGPKISSR